MKFLVKGLITAVALVVVLAIIGLVQVHRHKTVIDDARVTVIVEDEAIKKQEELFLEQAKKLLGKEEEFSKSIDEFSAFQGSRIERQKRFVWLSGNVLTQLLDKGDSASEVKLLEEQLTRRSLLVRRFEREMAAYQTLCAGGWQTSIVRMLGRCSDSPLDAGQ